MAEVEELIVRAKPEGVTETTDQLEGMEEQFTETSGQMGEQAGMFQEMANRISGLMGAVVAGTAVAAGGLLTQVPVVGEAASGMMSIVNALAYQIDKDLRPALTGFTDDLYGISGEIYGEKGTLSALDALATKLGQLGIESVGFAIEGDIVGVTSEKIITFVFPELGKGDIINAVFNIDLSAAAIVTAIFGGLGMTANMILGRLFGFTIAGSTVISYLLPALAGAAILDRLFGSVNMTEAMILNSVLGGLTLTAGAIIGGVFGGVTITGAMIVGTVFGGLGITAGMILAEVFPNVTIDEGKLLGYIFAGLSITAAAILTAIFGGITMTAALVLGAIFGLLVITTAAVLDYIFGDVEITAADVMDNITPDPTGGSGDGGGGAGSPGSSIWGFIPNVPSGFDFFPSTPMASKGDMSQRFGQGATTVRRGTSSDVYLDGQLINDNQKRYNQTNITGNGSRL